MKRLDELGISPAPWTHKIENGAEWNSVWDARDGELLSGGYSESVADARLIASAPKLYSALYDVISYCEENHLALSDKFRPILLSARAALVEASGESETK